MRRRSRRRCRVRIDLAHLARMTFGERSLEREILALFDRQAGMLLARMRGEPPKVAAHLRTRLAAPRGASEPGRWRRPRKRVERLAASRRRVALAGAVSRVSAAVADAQAMIADLLRAR